MQDFSLSELETTIRNRAGATAADSYTKQLLDAGMPRIAKKFGEEAIEAIIAAMENRREAIIGESADVLYHLLVLLHAADIPLSEVLGELQKRTERSGHAEKAGRTK